MPSDAAGRVAWWPALLESRCCVAGSEQCFEDRLAEGRDGSMVTERRLSLADPKLTCIGHLGSKNMLDDCVAVATPATRSLAQPGRCAGDDAVKHGPCA